MHSLSTSYVLRCFRLVSNPLVMSDTEEAEKIADTKRERDESAATENFALVGTPGC